MGGSLTVGCDSELRKQNLSHPDILVGPLSGLGPGPSSIWVEGSYPGLLQSRLIGPIHQRFAVAARLSSQYEVAFWSAMGVRVCHGSM
jgi:hypothetical protein